MHPCDVLLAEPKDCHEGLIDTPLLLWAHPAHEFTEASCVNAADLLNQDDRLLCAGYRALRVRC
jgi:hypothetical protein